MRTLAILALAFSAAVAVARGECVATEPQLSSANIRVVVSLDDKPVKGVEVSVYQTGVNSKPLYTLTTDEKGVAVPPELAPGNYQVEALTWKAAPYDFYIIVPMDGRVTPIEYPVKMQSDWSLRKVASEVKAGEWKSVTLRRFSGVVYDPSGTPIPGATIEVWRIGDDGELIDGQTEASAGNDGEFSLDLQDGMYVAVFRSLGFRRQITTFEVAASEPPNTAASPFVITLEIGRCARL